MLVNLFFFDVGQGALGYRQSLAWVRQTVLPCERRNLTLSLSLIMNSVHYVHTVQNTHYVLYRRGRRERVST